MNSRRLTFEGANGDQLAARLDMPDAPPTACALFAHCFTCSKDLKAVGRISKALTSEGIGVLRFDFTGLGESEGDFADTGFASNVEDLVAAARFLEREVGTPRILVGHSLGGAAVIQAAHEIEGATAVATIGAPADPVHVEHLLGDAREVIERDGEAKVTIGGRPFLVRRKFLDDLDGARQTERIRTLGRPLLIFHSPVDTIVGIENAAMIFEAARHPKSFVSLDRADHLLTGPDDADYVGRVLAAWSRKYIN
ncbi:MAG: alpha/beta hydrolase [Gemmatimonadota bacterium]|nr:alpha/beta hydrolase [Gemmatimonadota bacterium]